MERDGDAGWQDLARLRLGALTDLEPCRGLGADWGSRCKGHRRGNRRRGSRKKAGNRNFRLFAWCAEAPGLVGPAASVRRKGKGVGEEFLLRQAAGHEIA